MDNRDTMIDFDAELDAVVEQFSSQAATPPQLEPITDERAEEILQEKASALDAEIEAELRAELAQDDAALEAAADSTIANVLAEIAQEDAAEAAAAIPETVTLETFPAGTPSYQELESFVRQIAEMQSLRDQWEAMPEDEREESPEDMDVEGDTAFEAFHREQDLIEEARKLFPKPYTVKRAPASLGAAAVPVEEAPAESSTEAQLKPYSVIVGWEQDYIEAGTYAWSGLARDEEHAEESARKAAGHNHEGEGPDGALVEIVEGVNIWAARDLLAALKEVTNHLRDEYISPVDEPEAHEMLVRAMKAIAKAECRE